MSRGAVAARVVCPLGFLASRDDEEKGETAGCFFSFCGVGGFELLDDWPKGPSTAVLGQGFHDLVQFLPGPPRRSPLSVLLDLRR